MTDAEREGLYDEGELNCEPNTGGGIGPAGTLSTEETDRLINEYRREAGTLGANKLFSASKVGFHFGVGVAYDDNIRTTVGSQKEADEITTLNGGVTVGLGDYIARENTFLAFDYSLTENLFAVHGGQDALDQNGLLDARYRWSRLALELTSRYRVDHDPSSEFVQRDDRHVYNEELSARYAYGDKTTLIAEARYDRIDAEIGESNEQYSWQNAVDYRAFDKISLGLGLGLGYLDGDDGLHEIFEQLLARFNYQVADKISVIAQLGVDIRERGSYAGDSATPIFALEGDWTPYNGTTLTLGGYRRVEASETTEGQDLTSTNVSLGARQLFLRHFYFLVDVNYAHNDYANVTGTFLPSRSDNYYYARTGFGYEADKYFDLGIFYRHQQNTSTQSNYAYASNRVYLQTNFVY